MREPEATGMDAAAVTPDLHGWLPKPEAARLLKMGERTLDRMVKLKGYPEVRMRPRDGRRPEPMVNPEDLKQMLAGRNVTVVMPGESAASVALARAPAYPADRVLEVIDRVAQAGRAPELPLWLTLKKASAYSGLSMALLQRLCAAGHILSVKDNGWKINRKALEFSSEEIAEKGYVTLLEEQQYGGPEQD